MERDTGIGRDTLRIWERRDGFPTPERNEKGERVYSAEQIRRLQRIRRMLDQGMRPGKVVPLDDEALGKLAAALPAASSSIQDIDPVHAKLIALASSGDVPALPLILEQALARDGLRSFVLDTFAPLTTAIGELWAGGQLQVFEEHLLTRHLVHFLVWPCAVSDTHPGIRRFCLRLLPASGTSWDC